MCGAGPTPHLNQEILLPTPRSAVSLAQPCNDVVVIQEAFDNSSSDALKQKAAGQYPSSRPDGSRKPFAAGQRLHFGSGCKAVAVPRW